MKRFMHFILMMWLFITKVVDTLMVRGDYRFYFQLEWRVWGQNYMTFLALLLYDLFV